MEPLNLSDKKTGVPEEPTPDLLRDLQVQRNDTWKKELDNPYSPASYQNEFVLIKTEIPIESQRPKTSVLGFLYTGGITGAAMSAGMYGLDSRLLAIPEAERSGMMKMWEKISPTAKALQHHSDAAKIARTTFSTTNQAHAIAQLELDAVANIPKTLVKAAEAHATLLKPAAEQLAHLAAQKSYLQSRAAIASADDVMKTIGLASEVGKNGVLFERGSAAATQLETYATQLRTRGSGGAGVAAPNFTASIAEVEAKLGAIATQVTEIGTVQQRLTFFRSGLAGNTVSVKQVLGTSAEVAAGQKLFERGSAEAAELLNYAAKAEAHAAVTKTLDTVRTTMLAKESAMKAFMERGVSEYRGSLSGTTFRGLAKGLDISAATLAAGYCTDYALGQIFGYKPSTNDSGRFILDGVIVPSILLSGYQPKVRAAMAVVAFGLARGTECYLGTMAGTEMSTLLRPNMLEAAGVTSCALAPIPGKYKALGIAGTLALGRGYNLFARATGLDGFSNSGEATRATLMTSEMTSLHPIAQALPARLSTKALASSITVDRQELRRPQIIHHLDLGR